MGKINSLITSLGGVWDWIIGFIKFLVSAGLTILDNIGRFFLSIFNGDIFTILNNVLTVLSRYLGSFGATAFLGLFALVFSILIMSFIFRLLRGRVNYDSTLKKYHKNHPNG